jgi:hypothetical protein
MAARTVVDYATLELGVPCFVNSRTSFCSDVDFILTITNVATGCKFEVVLEKCSDARICSADNCVH